MLDQSFSASNLRDVYELENRRGKGIDKRFFPTLHAINRELTAQRDKLRKIRRDNPSLPADQLIVLTDPVFQEISSIRDRREKALLIEMDLLAAKLASGGFRLTLNKKLGPGGKYVFPTDENSESYFASRQLQHNIARVYKVKPANRRLIVEQLRDVLAGGFTLNLVKADISSFFETVPTKPLLAKISSDQLLSRASKQHIRTAIESYNILSASQVGLPRGLGISSYLSELFLREFDDRVKKMSNIVYYARYVDDIVAVFAPEPGQTDTRFLDDITDEIRNVGLAHNPQKTRAYIVDQTRSARFDFLGYTFDVQGKNCAISISSLKIAKIRQRIDLCLTAFSIEKVKNYRSAYRLCVARMRFLTGNTRLTNNKGSVYTGIFYNNSAASELSTLRGLDQYYNHKIGQLANPSLTASLGRFSFEQGFADRTFTRINTKRLASITGAWSQ